MMIRIAFTLATIFLMLPPALVARDLPTSKIKPGVCVGCHGPDGNSRYPESPNLAGQQTEYFKIQIRAFRQGIRVSPIMEIITRSMNEADAEELADYFARFPPKYSGRASKSSSYSKLYGVCADCHGVKGEGLGINPRIAGQHSLYTYRQLLQYKTGVRLQPEMRALLQGLPDDELKALADYLAALR